MLFNFGKSLNNLHFKFAILGAIKSTKIASGKSNFPEGDNDYFKNVERFSTTTNNSQFKPVSQCYFFNFPASAFGDSVKKNF